MFTTLDYVIVVVYLVGIALFGILRGGKQRSAQEYFLGKERIPWWIVCFAIVAAETSTLTFISIPGLAYLTNLTFLQVTFGYLLGRILVSYLFLPAYYKGELSTAYAFLESRFGAKTRRFSSGVFLFTRIAADGVRLFATAIPLKFVLDVEYPVAILILSLVALSYTTYFIQDLIYLLIVSLLAQSGQSLFLFLLDFAADFQYLRQSIIFFRKHIDTDYHLFAGIHRPLIIVCRIGNFSLNISLIDGLHCPADFINLTDIRPGLVLYFTGQPFYVV